MAGIDLKGILGGAVSTAFGLTTDAQKSVTIHSRGGDEVYDPATNTYGGGVAATYSGIDAIYYQTKQQQGKDDSANTAMLLIQKAKLSTAGLPIIKEADTVTFDGITWEIDRVDIDPVGVTWILSVRK